MRKILMAFALALGACASPDPRPTADDPVCLANGDLGCVCVRVDEKTPRSTYRGKTYYFCAERCRVAFEKSPEKYLETGR
jgi:YHS domain-containing protein